ncbi:hypothetical protein SAMN05421780_10388 [Flexibacter flexilis DSM 6793]|uniref:Uncharacterized protein n=1 Tax=Flexibacter flexilis DSM 6793 TaxID=927664 RepID=A0A1I1H0R2_9BACT|nr:hypothetical protein [Flexibacter flexilis]SFC14993.1 hypothetical protein SAMN05421780_10388 [Flexibacter flexilis DSM 6793]
MTSFEQTEKPLTDADLQQLRNTRNSAVLIGGLVIAIFVAISAAIIVSSDGGLAWFSAIMPVLGMAIIGYMLYKYNQDVGYGKKVCIKGTITGKKQHTTRNNSKSSSSSSSTAYYLIIGENRRVSVNADVYQKYHLGEGIELEMTKHSETILAQKHLEGSIRIEEQTKNQEFRQKQAYISPSSLSDLTPDDCRAIRKARTRSIWGFVGWLFILAFISIFVVIFGMIFLAFVVFEHLPKQYLPYVGQFLTYGVPAIVLVALGNWLISRLLPFNRDLAEGQKEIQTMYITDKFASNVQVTSSGWRVTSSSGQYYYAVINGRNYDIDYALYEKIDNSHPVQVHLAPHSKVLLRIDF